MKMNRITPGLVPKICDQTKQIQKNPNNKPRLASPARLGELHRIARALYFWILLHLESDAVMFTHNKYDTPNSIE